MSLSFKIRSFDIRSDTYTPKERNKKIYIDRGKKRSLIEKTLKEQVL